MTLLAGNGTMCIAAHPQVGQEEEFWFSDGPHTVRHELDRHNFNSAHRDDDHCTVLPTLSALSATWDVNLARRFGEVLGSEARDRGKDVLLGPGVNLQRTPLNGRNYEYMGEDPCLAGKMAAAYVRGLQSMDVAACVKHWAGNEQELERSSVDIHMDERVLRELYAAPFEEAVIEAGVLTVMNGYNRFRGEYCSHNAALNNDLLKGEWGFPGFVVSDWGGLHDTLLGALGGLDVEMHAGEAIRYFKQPLVEAVRDGRVPESVIDDKARRVLYVMARIGKLGGRSRAGGARNTPEHQAFAREVAAKSMVLLRNEDGVLPLDRNRVRRLLLIGANANARHAAGGWSAEGKPPYETTPLEGLTSYLGESVEIEYVPGPFAEIHEGLEESVIETINTGDLEHGAAQKGWEAEYFSGQELEGDPVARGFFHHLDISWQNFIPAANLRKGDFSVRWSVEITAPESGTYSFSLTHDSRARLTVDGDCILDGWEAGEVRTNTVTADLEAGRRHRICVEYVPGPRTARMAFGWLLPSMHPVRPAELVDRSRGADTVIFMTGNMVGHGRAHESEGGDRPSMALPKGHDAAIAAVLEARPDTVIIVQSGSPVEMPWSGRARTLLHYWFSGMEGGNALPQVLFGEVNPGGKLPFSIPHRLEDTPAHALGNYGPDRVEYKEGVLVGYRWHDARGVEPLFPFGYGLSYTRFAIQPPILSATEISIGSSLTVRTRVTNTGRRSGTEVVQLYLGAENPALPRPPRELKAFRRVQLKPGQTEEIEFALCPRDFAVWDTAAGKWRVDAGRYHVQVGSSSRCLTDPAHLRLRHL